ncbi:hypothetical protein [uncultured Pseudokineococcus sp.]|uniref:hypothetical protein n=1 Tax=uncultured Pseudokineococcus sp. TaxID=1642928 RepID=UPI00260DA649|nr:hypothetical protein [uncultured Pseudokineococcus sp.]
MIAAAIPRGSLRAPAQKRWLAAVASHPDVATWRADRTSSWLAVAREVALCADWTWGTTRPTWDHLAERTGRSRRTVARVLAWLRQTGLLGLVATGRSAGAAAMALDEGADAAVYVLAVPHALRLLTTIPSPAAADIAGDQEDTAAPPAPMGVHEAGTPSPEGVSEGDPRAGARAKPTPPPTSRPLSPWPRTQRPATKPEMAAAAATARTLCPPLRCTTGPWVVALLREFWLAGWTLRDTLRALDERPDGTPWPHTADIRHVPGWVRSRLAAWRTDAGTPQRSPSQTSAAAQHHTRALARARAERRQLEQTHRASAPAAAAGAAAARAALRAARTNGRTDEDGQR